MEVANEILNQIKALDKWALGSWGAHNFIGGKIFEGKEGIKFQVRGTKMTGWAMIVLDYATDTYEIYTYRIRNCEVKFNNQIKMVYNDQLLEILDGFIG